MGLHEVGQTRVIILLLTVRVCQTAVFWVLPLTSTFIALV